MHITVGVLRGGPSREHDVSLRSGAAMLAHLPEDRFVARDLYIDRKGVWHDRGKPIAPDRALRQLDVALIGLHGEYGEDGTVQKLLERYGIPYVGADSFAAYLAMHKVMAKMHAREAGILTPEFHYASRKTDAARIARNAVRQFHQPLVVKPVGWGSSVGVAIVGGYAPVLAAIEELFRQGATGVLIEEYIRGREATAGVVEALRNELLYALPVVEIIPPAGGMFSYDAKYVRPAREIVPGHFSRLETEALQAAAKQMHRVLGLRDYSRSDFIVTPRGVYYLETNALPGLTAESLFPKSLAAVGVSFPEFLSHLVDRALSR